MDSRLFMNRSENEIKLAEIIFTISDKTDIQTETFKVKEPETYYSAVIAHSYYSIFYGAKALLLKKAIEVSMPQEHKKTFNAFKKLVNSGELDVELLVIYKAALVRAEYLLGLFKEEKQKRGEFTYKTLPQANKKPAEESLEHAKLFYKHINNLLM
jgi:uncharacterized protein (UPF0332 family)